MAFGLSACPGPGGSDAGADTPFAIDAFPAMVNRTPYALTGSKPIGSSVQVDGAERVAAGQGTAWTIELALAEGRNHFLVSPVDSAGQAGTAIAVDLTLDTLAPTLVTKVPAAGASAVPLNTSVEAVFSEAIDCASITSSVFSLRNTAAALGCVTTGTTTTARLTPSAPLAASTQFTVLLLGAGTLADLAGNKLAADVTWQFTSGTSADTTPPVPPTFASPAPPGAPTKNALITVGGTKEANASVEHRWTVDGALQQDWTEIAGKSSATTWGHDFALNLGSNLVQLRSADLAMNVSTVVSFTVVREQNTAVVSPPALSAVVTPTSVGNQVLRGTKPTATSVYNGATLLVPQDSATSWTALVKLNSGANDFDLTARDGSGNVSAAAARQTIQYNPPGPVTAGQVRIDFEVRDLFPFIGDEFNASSGGNDINHFAFDLWAEGPITRTGSSSYESCVFDPALRQRKHTRYVASVSHTKAGAACNAAAGACNGYWWDADYYNPNYMAALIESGRWNTSPPTSYPFAPGVVRRDPATGQQWPTTMVPDSTVGHDVPKYQQIWFPNFASCCGWGAKPKLLQPPQVDGLTEASTNAGFSQTTRLAANGAALGAWSTTKTYRWNLKDFNAAFVQKGPYLLQLTATVDRGGPGDTTHWASTAATDRETCWDDPAQATVGAHRAEGILEIDGVTPQTVYWKEKAADENVNACAEAPSGMTARVRCNCGSSTTFPCPALPNAQIGAKVLYLNPAKYTDPSDGQTYAVKVQYCPTGPCP